jgi:hypothetical protein
VLILNIPEALSRRTLLRKYDTPSIRKIISAAIAAFAGILSDF